MIRNNPGNAQVCPDLQVPMVVTEVPTFLIIIQDSSGLIKNYSFVAMYLHAKIGSLDTVKSCVTIGPIL